LGIIWLITMNMNMLLNVDTMNVMIIGMQNRYDVFPSWDGIKKRLLWIQLEEHQTIEILK